MSQISVEFSKILGPYKANRFLLAVSGGRDSMALFHLFLHMREHFKVEFAVAHIHHGDEKSQQGQYRNKAQEFVKNICQLHQVKFHTNQPAQVQTAGSENEWRQLRYAQLESILSNEGYDWLVLAHHGQDQMETRIIRLIRGTGSQGLEGMKFVDRARMRPLLQFQPEELTNYLQDQNAKWLDDPSNFIPDKFRNWLRNDWLPILEKYRPGSLSSLARSLEVLAEPGETGLPQCIFANRLSLSEFYPLSRADKQRVLAQFMNHLGLKNYGMSHINEILKRLDSNQKALKFQLLRRYWILDAGHLKVLGPGQIEQGDG